MQQQPCLQEISPQNSRYSINHEVHTHSTKNPSLSSFSTCESTTTNSTIGSFQLSRPPSQTSPLSADSTTNFIPVADLSLSGFDKQQPVSSEKDPSDNVTDNSAILDSSKIQKRLRTKYNLIRELVNTEETFTSDIAVVIDIYNHRLQKESYHDLISDRDVQALFTNLDQVLLLSRQFVSRLKECIPAYILTECDLTPPEAFDLVSTNQRLKDVKSHIGQIMLEYIPNLEATYKTYCSQSEFQLNTFYRINTQGSPMVDQWLLESREASKDKTQAWSLDALLIKPVQRLMKYPLLLKSMLDATPQDHPDYLPLAAAIEKIQDSANRINAIEPETFSFESFPKEVLQQDASHLGDYNTVMSQMKTDPRCDQELEILLVQFDRKQRHVQNLIKYLRKSIFQIQKHFDVNSALAHAWYNWLSEDSDILTRSPKNKMYKRFAIFALPFTTSSSANVSTNELMRLVENGVIDPLNDMWLCYFNTGNTIVLRERYHKAYQKYVAHKERLEASDGDNLSQLDSVTLANADSFLRLHNRLKNELPVLFSMTEDIIDTCLVKFLAIQRDWFRVAVDSTSNVFGLTLSDIRRIPGKEDPILADFKNKLRANHKAHKIIDEDLKICKPQPKPKIESQPQPQHQQQHPRGLALQL
ncbi:hypothetical protein D0Z00_004051 [Geotrichum galactomycetum]|uniref:Uncharacterized protein n=1 Tax=Geotrichum galactomycetum TaxID=27317 RepID=A0ACB6UZJ1_9ASCO|nr:hypothetical protein D0Z00_004051 [Geotrichum candidum]